MPKITVDITDEQVRVVEQLVASGAYAGSGDVVAAALEEFNLRYRLDHANPGTVQRLRDLWDEGIASGFAGPVDFDELLQEAHRELQIPLRRTA